MTSNTTRPTTTESGAPHYPNLYKNLSEEHTALQVDCSYLLDHSKQLENLQEEHTGLQNDYRKQKSKLEELESHNEQLHVEASRSIDNLQERNYYKKSARLWCACSVILTASWIIFAVTL